MGTTGSTLQAAPPPPQYHCFPIQLSPRRPVTPPSSACHSLIYPTLPHSQAEYLDQMYNHDSLAGVQTGREQTEESSYGVSEWTNLSPEPTSAGQHHR